MGINAPYIGQMRTLGTLQINTPTRMTAGYKDDYSNSGAVRVHGYLLKKNGGRKLETGELVLSSQYEWFTRQLKDITDALKPSSKWVIEGKVYAIDSYEKVDGKNMYYRFLITEDQVN